MVEYDQQAKQGNEVHQQELTQQQEQQQQEQEISENSGKVFSALQLRFREAIRSCIVYKSSRMFSYILETIDTIPTPEFIADGAMYVLEKAQIFPCKMTIYAGLFLRKYNQESEQYEYRYFHPGNNTQIGDPFRFEKISSKNRKNIITQVTKDDYVTHLENYNGDLPSGWTFVEVSNLMYHVFRRF